MIFLRRLSSFRLSQVSAQTIHRSSICRPNSRQFSISSPRLAAENPDLQELYLKLSKTSVFKKLAESPAALEHLKAFSEVMKKQGIDPSKPPSKMQLLKLGMNKEVREAGMAMNKALMEAGVDLADKAVLEEIMTAMNQK